MRLDDLVAELKESGTSEFKLGLLRSIAQANPDLSLAGVVKKFGMHHNVTEGTVKKAREILARHEAKPAPTPQRK
jgi:hypothetical protein